MWFTHHWDGSQGSHEPQFYSVLIQYLDLLISVPVTIGVNVEQVEVPGVLEIIRRICSTGKLFYERIILLSLFSRQYLPDRMILEGSLVLSLKDVSCYSTLSGVNCSRSVDRPRGGNLTLSVISLTRLENISRLMARGCNLAREGTRYHSLVLNGFDRFYYSTYKLSRTGIRTQDTG